MPTRIVVVDTGKSFVQIPAIYKPVQDKALNLPVNGTADLLFIIVLTDELVERTGKRITRA